MNNFAKKEFYVVVAGGAILSLNAGFINSVCLNGLYDIAVSHLTGTVTRAALYIVKGDATSFGQAIGILGAFFFGCFLNGLLVGDSKFKLGRGYGYVLLLESISLALAAVIMPLSLFFGEFVAAFACGLQNSLATSYSGAVIRTTHMTGIITDLGIFMGHVVRAKVLNGAPFTDHWKFKVLIPLVFGFFVGSFLGYFAYVGIGTFALFIPSILTGVVALAYLSSELVQKAKERLSQLDRRHTRLMASRQASVVKLPNNIRTKDSTDVIEHNLNDIAASYELREEPIIAKEAFPMAEINTRAS